jgi:hypothetical protein
MLPTKFRFIWLCGFKGDLLEIDQSETRFAIGAMFINGSGRNVQSL